MSAFVGGDLAGYALDNLPLGVGRTIKHPSTASILTRLGSNAVDLRALAAAGLLSGPILSQTPCLAEDTLHGLMALGKPAWLELRETLQRLLSSAEGVLRDNVALREAVFTPLADVSMQLPASIGDYTDFYASRYHATNCGAMFRSIENALNPNWVHLPVGYHGRSSSIVVSGTNVHRPWGQILRPGSTTPAFQPSAAVDFELELACLIGPGTELGQPVPIQRAHDTIFGVALMNDWSARDIQKWEYVPLGPFNAKNWATSVSPWVVMTAALEPFKTQAEPQQPPVLPHLKDDHHHGLDIQLTVDIKPAGCGAATKVTDSNFKYIYWSFPQMIAHHTAGGCNLRPGDMLGSGTISGPDPAQRGCLLELTWAGANPVQLKGENGSTIPRTYLQDGDEVIMQGHCKNEGHFISLGECRGSILPAISL